MRFLVVIPARYRSTRFPGKPLADINGRPMILHVWDRCIAAVGEEQVCIATDDERIRDICRDGGARVVMTPDTCFTGTDRVFETSRQLEADIYVNVQGDEPLIAPEDLLAVIEAARLHPDDVVNAMCRIHADEDFRSLTVPKVVARPDGRLLYMSRAPIPGSKDAGFHGAMKQVCIYAFPRPALEAFAGVKERTLLEGVEDIEILRFLELGFEVRMIQVSESSVAVDTPEDLERVRKLMKRCDD
ncbi:MAG: 3-deoxy-manno-octulosonate cytidylyltransferase [Syntrophobacteraceae bacterium]